MFCFLKTTFLASSNEMVIVSLSKFWGEHFLKQLTILPIIAMLKYAFLDIFRLTNNPELLPIISLVLF